MVVNTKKEATKEAGTTTFSITEALKQFILLDLVSDSARVDIEVLLAWVLEKDRTYLYTWPEKRLSSEQNTRFIDALARRINGEPVAHITGEREFWSLPLYVDNSTLIPRPDTEIVVETALSLFEQDDPTQPRQLIDLGTGTGAIALALASEKPHWQITALDKNPKACALAEKNRQRHGLTQVTIVVSDWLSAVSGTRVDMIVTNPPYIDENDPHLSQGDVRFEPASALTAPKQGLADIEIIADQARGQLLAHGWLLIEHGYQQAPQVQGILQALGYKQVRTVDDLAGHPRVTLGQYCYE